MKRAPFRFRPLRSRDKNKGRGGKKGKFKRSGKMVLEKGAVQIVAAWHLHEKQRLSISPRLVVLPPRPCQMSFRLIRMSRMNDYLLLGWRLRHFSIQNPVLTTLRRMLGLYINRPISISRSLTRDRIGGPDVCFR